MKKIYQKPPIYNFTKEGLEKLKQEQKELKESRPDAVEHLKRAREMGDLSENGYYKASKSKLISIDNRLRRLEHIIKYAKIIQSTGGDIVQLGAQVSISDGKDQREFMIVGGYESNPAEGKISDASPLGKALLGKKVGSLAEISTPSGRVTYRIVDIK